MHAASRVVSEGEIQKNCADPFLNRGSSDLSPTPIPSGSLTIARRTPDILKLIDGLKKERQKIGFVRSEIKAAWV